MYMSTVFSEDLEQIISDDLVHWKELQNYAILVTGATGLIGSVLIRVLSAASERHGLNLRIFGCGRNAAKGEILCREFGIEFIGSDIRKPLPIETLPFDLDYIFHCAAVTRSADMASKPVDVIATAVNGTKNILELAVERHCKSMVFLSSMEVYGQNTMPEVTESDLGGLNLSDPRSSYPESKRLCEILCGAYAAQYGLPVKIVRLARVFGAGTPNNDADMRVASQFARKAMTGEDIELHTNGTSIANCCYTADAISGLLTILLKGKDGEVYNIANSAASMTVREMAELVATGVCGGRIKVVVKVPDDIAKRGYAPDVRYRLNVDKLNVLGWKARYGMKEMYRRMIADWREDIDKQ
jgi:nucleoside-diphosphate-sugar epimerase